MAREPEIAARPGQRGDTRETREPDFPRDVPERAMGAEDAGNGEPHARTERFLRRRDWRDSVVGTAGFLIAAGAWLVISPIFISYAEAGADIAAALIAGALVIILASTWAITAHEGVALPAGLVLVGAALAIGGGWAGGGEAGEWNLRITGAAIVFLAFAGTAASSSGFLRSAHAPEPGARTRR